jgi:hypothetical protein
VGVGAFGRGRERPAAHHRHQVDQGGEGDDVVASLFGGHASPRGELVGAQPDGQYAGCSQLGSHGGEHLAGQPEPVGAVGVGTVVGQPGVELAQQRPGPDVDLDPAEAGCHGPARGVGEAGNQGDDVFVLHGSGKLA